MADAPGDGDDEQPVWRSVFNEDGTVPYRPVGPDGRPLEPPRDERPWYRRVPWWGWLLLGWGVLSAIVLVALFSWCVAVLNGTA